MIIFAYYSSTESYFHFVLFVRITFVLNLCVTMYRCMCMCQCMCVCVRVCFTLGSSCVRDCDWAHASLVWVSIAALKTGQNRAYQYSNYVYISYYARARILYISNMYLSIYPFWFGFCFAWFSTLTYCIHIEYLLWLSLLSAYVLGKKKKQNCVKWYSIHFLALSLSHSMLSSFRMCLYIILTSPHTKYGFWHLAHT